MTRCPHPAVLRVTALMMLLVAPLTVGPASADPTDPTSGVESGSSDWRQVSVGYEHTCGIRTSGRLYCWGNDSDGRLGDGGPNTSQPRPVEVFA